MQYLKIVSILLAAASTLGCASGGKMAYVYEAQDSASPPAMARAVGAHKSADKPTASSPGEGEAPRLSVVEARKLVYTGQFKLIVEDVRVAQAAARKLAERLGGYLGRLDARSMVIRVPAERFNEAVAALPAIGTVADRRITAQDVTDKYLDLTTRLKNAQALAARLRALLDKAETVKDALLIEKELARVQVTIDRMEGQLKLLSSQIAYATLTLEFHGAVRYTPPTLRVKLPIRWLRELGLNNLLRFGDKEIY